MNRYPAIVVHGLRDARDALLPALPVTLLSAQGAGVYAGCLWWRALVARARAEHPDVAIADLLDCADASGRALAAIRSGQQDVVLAASSSAFPRVVAVAAQCGARVHPVAPPALDLSLPSARRRLADWLRACE